MTLESPVDFFASCCFFFFFFFFYFFLHLYTLCASLHLLLHPPHHSTLSLGSDGLEGSSCIVPLPVSRVIPASSARLSIYSIPTFWLTRSRRRTGEVKEKATIIQVKTPSFLPTLSIIYFSLRFFIFGGGGIFSCTPARKPKFTRIIRIKT